MMLGRAVFFHPFTPQARRFLRRQPGPIGTAGANRHPDSVAMHVFLNRERATLRHRHIHFHNEMHRSRVTATIPPRQRDRFTCPLPSPSREARARDNLLRRPGYRNYKIGNAPQKSQNRRCRAGTCAFGHNLKNGVARSTTFSDVSVARKEQTPACSRTGVCMRVDRPKHAQPILANAARIAGTRRYPDSIEKFQDLDRHFAAIVQPIPERGGREFA